MNKYKKLMMLAQKIYRYILPVKIYNYPLYIQQKFINELALNSKGKTVLDAGAGECPFKPLFKDSKYISQDISSADASFDYSKVDIRSEIYDIPLENSSVDFILCSEVLEHLQYPDQAFKEFYRLLKPKGQLWISVPFSGGEHQIPYDFYRYTKYALKGFGHDSNLSVVNIKNQGGAFIYLGLAIKNLPYNIFSSGLGFVLGSMIIFPIVFILLPILYFLDRFDKYKKLTPGYLVVYEK